MELGDDFLEYLQSDVDFVAQGGLGVSLNDGVLCFTNSAGEHTHTALVSALYEFDSQPHEVLREFLIPIFCDHFRQATADCGLDITDFKETGFAKFQWRWKSHLYSAEIRVGSGMSVQIGFPESELHTIPARAYPKLPSNEDIRKLMEDSDNDLKVNLRFRDFLNTKTERDGTAVKWGNESGIISVGPFRLIILSGEILVTIQRWSSDEEGIRQVLGYVAEFKAKLKTCLDPEPDPGNGILTDLTLA